MRRMLAALALAAGASSASAAERLAHPPEPGFIIGFDRANAAQAIQEWVPKGETVEDWSRMLTFQRFIDVRSRGQTPTGLLQYIADQIRIVCPGARVSAVTPFTSFGRTGAKLATTCPRNPATGKPEKTFYRACAGARDLHVAQVAFRSIASATGAQWANAYLDKVVVCGTPQADAQPMCKAP